MNESNLKKEDHVSNLEKKIDNITKSIEKNRETKITDILTAVLLALATIFSAWCAFQSTLWGGEQTFNLAFGSRAGRLASENNVKSIQIRSVDALLLVEYINAGVRGDKELQKFYYDRFNPILKKSTDEWLSKDPYNNPNAPNSPLAMVSYVLPEDIEAQKQLEEAADFVEQANEDNKTSDRYILLTVLFAGVLFFGGIANTFRSRMLLNVCLIISAVIFLITTFFLFWMPVTTI